jgi:hypothetical protein
MTATDHLWTQITEIEYRRLLLGVEREETRCVTLNSDAKATRRLEEINSIDAGLAREVAALRLTLKNQIKRDAPWRRIQR